MERLEPKQYNEAINKVPSNVLSYTFVNSRGILIKSFKFEENTTTKSGLEIPAYKNHFTQGGKEVSRMNEKEYSTRAIVVAISPSASKYIEEHWNGVSLQPGDEVLVMPQGISGSTEFYLDRDKPVTGDDGYFILHPNSIDCKTNNHYELIKND
jgi:co-chaperonin GroES (HSP10)